MKNNAPIIENKQQEVMCLDTQKYIALREKKTGKIWGIVPLISMPEDADYRWQLDALNSRLEHPEYYESDEDVPAVIERLKQWLINYEQKHQDYICKAIN